MDEWCLAPTARLLIWQIAQNSDAQSVNIDPATWHFEGYRRLPRLVVLSQYLVMRQNWLRPCPSKPHYHSRISAMPACPDGAADSKC